MDEAYRETTSWPNMYGSWTYAALWRTGLG